MKLKDYPQAIAKLQLQLLTLDQALIMLQESLSILSVEIEKQIVSDAALTNDTKRKAKRLALQQSDPDYARAARELKAAQMDRDRLDIDLLLLRNQFSVLKLEERRAIASLELQASTAA